ncbi:MAG: FAA hydrolase family protein [Bacteroidetes bacterium]|nr:MAG: FAA hydrolase family protein [Bacteroidota bacterium]
MKILAIGRNYVAHIEELKNEKPTEPVVFLKPDTALLQNNEPFYYPEFSQDIHHEVEIVLRVGKEGKHIEPKFASRYYDQIGLGIDFTARDIQTRAKEKGLPWETAKAFNGSAPVSKFLPVGEFADLKNINFCLEVNGEVRQEGNTSLMLYDFDYIVSYLSKFFTLKAGDLIYTGTPAGVSAVKVGDRLVGFIEKQEMFNFEVK